MVAIWVHIKLMDVCRDGAYGFGKVSMCVWGGGITGVCVWGGGCCTHMLHLVAEPLSATCRTDPSNIA